MYCHDFASKSSNDKKRSFFSNDELYRLLCKESPTLLKLDRLFFSDKFLDFIANIFDMFVAQVLSHRQAYDSFCPP